MLKKTSMHACRNVYCDSSTHEVYTSQQCTRRSYQQYNNIYVLLTYFFLVKQHDTVARLISDVT